MHAILKKSIVLLFLVSACAEKPDTLNASDSTPADQVNLTEAQFNLVGIKLGKIESRPISHTIKANGMLDVPPQNMVTVSAVLGGFVKKTELLQGMKITKGQIIAIMENPDYIQLQQDYLENKSLLDFYESEYQRQQELAKENINAAKTLQQAQSNFLGTKAKVEGLKSKLKLINIPISKLENGIIQNEINIYAPISGYVTQVNANVGLYVNPTDVLFKIVDMNHLHVELIVYEKDVLKIKIGQQVRFHLANESSERIASVFLIGKEISTERTVQVHCHLEKEEDNFLPGMYLSALVETSQSIIPSLPEQAVINFEGNDYIFITMNEAKREYKMIKVTKGTAESGFTEIILPAGVDPNSSVVVEGAYDLLAYLKNAEEE